MTTTHRLHEGAREPAGEPDAAQPRRFAGKRALVTGAGSGIGRAVARRLAAEGATVSGVDLSAEGLRETFAGIPGARSLVADICAPDSLDMLSDELQADVLVNAAGVLLRHDLLGHSLDDWERTFAVNLKAPFRLSREFARCRVRRGATEDVASGCAEAAASGVMEAAASDATEEIASGARAGAADGPRTETARGSTASIVNVCSIESFVALPGHAAYTASKAALLMLTRAFALELAPHGIRVNGVAPGVTETGMNAALRADPQAAGSLRDAIPLGRFAGPDEQAAGVCFLASDEASYITGAVLSIDGGWLTR